MSYRNTSSSTSSKSRFGKIKQINEDINLDDLEVNNLRIKSIINIDNKIIAEVGEIRNLDVGNININDNIINLDNEYNELKINGENISLNNNKNENCLYLNGNKNLIGINNNNPQANLDINCN